MSNLHKQNLLNIINIRENKDATLADVDFSLPIKPTENNPVRNTYCIITSRSHSGFYGFKKLWYNRLHESEINPVIINRGTANLESDLLPSINEKYNINLTIDDINDKMIPNNLLGELTINLDFKDDSYLVYKGDLISNQPLNFISRDDLNWDTNTATSGSILNQNNNLLISMETGIQSIKTNPLSLGKRYAEFIVKSNSALVGVCDDLYDNNLSLDATEHSWVIDISRLGVYENNNKVFDLSPYSNKIGFLKPIGIMLDLDTKTFALLVEDNILININTISLPSGNIYFVVGSKGSSLIEDLETNLGQNQFFYTPLIGY